MTGQELLTASYGIAPLQLCSDCLFNLGSGNSAWRFPGKATSYKLKSNAAYRALNALKSFPAITHPLELDCFTWPGEPRLRTLLRNHVPSSLRDSHQHH